MPFQGIGYTNEESKKIVQNIPAVGGNTPNQVTNTPITPVATPTSQPQPVIPQPAPVPAAPQPEPQVQPQVNNVDYMAEINKLKAVNPNDPQIGVLQQQRDAKIESLYGNNYQAEINKRVVANPNDPLIGDLQRLRETKVQNQQPNNSPWGNIASAATNVVDQVKNIPAPVTIEQPNDQIINGALQGYNDATISLKDVVNQIKATPFVDQYSDLKKQYLTQLGKQFEYNPETDLALKQAQKNASRAAMEALNASGILNSTVTADRVAEAMRELEPQYRKIAFDEYNNQMSFLLQKVNFYQGLTEFDYNQYKDWVNQNMDIAKTGLDTAMTNLDTMYKIVEYKDNQDLNKLKKQQAAVEEAMKRVDMLGYVDNEASVILGLPVGTPSQKAQERALEYAYSAKEAEVQYNMSIKEKAIQHQYDMQDIAMQAEKNKELEAIRTANDINLENIRTANDKELAKTKESTTTQGLKYKDYYDSGFAMKKESYQDKLGNRQRVYSDDTLKEWVFGLPISDEEQVQLINDLGLKPTK